MDSLDKLSELLTSLRNDIREINSKVSSSSVPSGPVVSSSQALDTSFEEYTDLQMAASSGGSAAGKWPITGTDNAQGASSATDSSYLETGTGLSGQIAVRCLHSNFNVIMEILVKAYCEGYTISKRTGGYTFVDDDDEPSIKLLDVEVPAITQGRVASDLTASDGETTDSIGSDVESDLAAPNIEAPATTPDQEARNLETPEAENPDTAASDVEPSPAVLITEAPATASKIVLPGSTGTDSSAPGGAARDDELTITPQILETATEMVDIAASDDAGSASLTDEEDGQQEKKKKRKKRKKRNKNKQKALLLPPSGEDQSSWSRDDCGKLVRRLAATRQQVPQECSRHKPPCKQEKHIMPDPVELFHAWMLGHRGRRIKDIPKAIRPILRYLLQFPYSCWEKKDQFIVPTCAHKISIVDGMLAIVDEIKDKPGKYWHRGAGKEVDELDRPGSVSLPVSWCSFEEALKEGVEVVQLVQLLGIALAEKERSLAAAKIEKT